MLLARHTRSLVVGTHRGRVLVGDDSHSTVLHADHFHRHCSACLCLGDHDLLAQRRSFARDRSQCQHTARVVDRRDGGRVWLAAHALLVPFIFIEYDLQSVEQPKCFAVAVVVGVSCRVGVVHLHRNFRRAVFVSAQLDRLRVDRDVDSGCADSDLHPLQFATTILGRDLRADGSTRHRRCHRRFQWTPPRVAAGAALCADSLDRPLTADDSHPVDRRRQRRDDLLSTDLSRPRSSCHVCFSWKESSAAR